MATGKKIAVVCTGAVGGYAGAHMVQAGEDVTFIDFWPEHVEHMKSHGLTITHIREVEPFTVPVRALHVTELQHISKEKPIDIAFVCTKSYDTAWATTMIKQYLAPDGYVVSLQNCMNEETIAGVVGWGKTLGCIASSIVVNLPAPGHIHRGAGKGGKAHTVFRTGEVHGRITARVEEVCRLVGTADSAMVTPNLWGERWSKLVANVMGNGLSACTGLSGAEMLQNDAIRRFSTRLTMSVSTAFAGVDKPSSPPLSTTRPLRNSISVRRPLTMSWPMDGRCAPPPGFFVSARRWSS